MAASFLLGAWKSIFTGQTELSRKRATVLFQRSTEDTPSVYLLASSSPWQMPDKHLKEGDIFLASLSEWASVILAGRVWCSRVDPHHQQGGMEAEWGWAWIQRALQGSPHLFYFPGPLSLQNGGVLSTSSISVPHLHNFPCTWPHRHTHEWTLPVS